MTNRINDFVIKIANVNGTGSASANSLLMKAIFRMGVPVVGKNFFPSNIQGLPTWYEIRVTRDGYLCRSGQVDIMVDAQRERHDVAGAVAAAKDGAAVSDAAHPQGRAMQEGEHREHHRQARRIPSVPSPSPRLHFSPLSRVHFFLSDFSSSSAFKRVPLSPSTKTPVDHRTPLSCLLFGILSRNLTPSFGTQSLWG